MIKEARENLEIIIRDLSEKDSGATSIIDIPIDAWREDRREIVRECCKHADINIQMNGGAGGGIKPGIKTIAIEKRKGMPAIEEGPELEKCVDELLSCEWGF